MKSLYTLLFAGALLAGAQTPKSDAEQEALRQAVGEAGSSPMEMTHALEGYLAKYPKAARRNDIELALLKAASEAKDNRRVVLYGERVLQREPADVPILESVTRALLLVDDKANAEKALGYGRRLEQALEALEKEKTSSAREEGQKREEIDRTRGKALVYQARALGNLSKLTEALERARASYQTYPTSESAREIARWLDRSGKPEDALPYLADAFMIDDPRRSEAERTRDRARLGEAYRKVKGSEAGLGDLVLAAYDRTTAQLAERRLKLRQLDPNANVTNPIEFTLSGLKGDKLALASLKGKVLILDFWATWCGPCRGQHPLYDQVKQRFKSRSDVVFLSVNTDEDHGLVEPFLDESKWSKDVYFEDGLSAALRVSSIPTTVIFGKRGEVFGRFNGYIPERFVDMLTERIQEALKE
ncbi:MAG: redoxin family protein [Acidobacteriales bacterium]|nr:redoxin family protein [Terriglobales bacterium]